MRRTGITLFAIAGLLLCSASLRAQHAVPAQNVPAQNATAPGQACSGEFEVATIKPHPTLDTTITFGGPPGKFQATNISAVLLVQQAFSLPSDQVSGGPSWVESERFDVNAKISDDCWQQLSKLHNEDREQTIRLMLRSLLKERFQLEISHHPKELMVYALVIAKGVPKLRPAGSPKQEQPSGSFLMGMDQRDTPVGDLAHFLSGYLGRSK